MPEKIPLTNLTENHPLPNENEETLARTKKITAKMLKNISEYHGWEHVSLVALNAKLLALGEGDDAFNAEMAAWTHDWGRAMEKKKKRPHAELSGEMSRGFYRMLWEDNKIDALQYGEIQRAIRRHSNKPGVIQKTVEGRPEEEKAKPMQEIRPAVKIIRDADRLSRFVVPGIYNNIYGLVEEGKPFYIPGDEVKRSDTQPMERKIGLSSAINAMNFVLEWEKMLETESAKRLLREFKPAYMAFLDLVEKHTDITDAELWVAFLKQTAQEFQAKSDEFENNFQWTNTNGDFDKWVEFYRRTGGTKIFSEENFQKFLIDYKNKT